MSANIESIVGGLQAQMEMVINLLQDIKRDLQSNYMPSAQIEDRFKAQGERIGQIERDLQSLELGVDQRFASKNDSIFKIIGAISGLVIVVATVTSGIVFLIHNLN